MKIQVTKIEKEPQVGSKVLCRVHISQEPDVAWRLAFGCQLVERNLQHWAIAEGNREIVILCDELVADSELEQASFIVLESNSQAATLRQHLL